MTDKKDPRKEIFALIEANKESALSEVRKLLQTHDHLKEARDKRYATPLLRACQRLNLNLVNELLHNDAKADVTDNVGWTAMHYTIFGAKTAITSEAMEIIKNKKFKEKKLYTQPCKQGMTPLMMAVEWFPASTGKESVEKPEESDGSEEEGSDGDEDDGEQKDSNEEPNALIEFFVKNTSSPAECNQKNHTQETAIDLAKQKSNECMKALVTALKTYNRLPPELQQDVKETDDEEEDDSDDREHTYEEEEEGGRREGTCELKVCATM